MYRKNDRKKKKIVADKNNKIMFLHDKKRKKNYNRIEPYTGSWLQ